ncbi:hypothetical protein NDU88_007126 [Pleurodeles waltl]|uniref:Uncharacterized protein n=1 Tax=Pleurodeles waltl TaxID=8319 RepID=A0AAV7NWH0_PLEWA|nr:hypothetical protein NDU88_007126 [Pleurodeles waltl]
MGAYHHSQETMATVLAKFQETQQLQEEPYLGFREELKSINTTLGTIARVLKDLVNTRRDTAPQLPQHLLQDHPPAEKAKLCSIQQATMIWHTFFGQHPPEEGYLACHRQGRPGPGGPPQTEHLLPEKMGGHSLLEQKNDGGPAGDGLPTWERCPSHHDPPDVPDPGGGVSGVGWVLEGITAATWG